MVIFFFFSHTPGGFLVTINLWITGEDLYQVHVNVNVVLWEHALRGSGVIVMQVRDFVAHHLNEC